MMSSGDGLLSVWCQTITWANSDQVNICIYVIEDYSVIIECKAL